jgi:membrane protein YqaA with SNARE-associated domain
VSTTIAAAFALGFNIPTLFAAPSLPASATGIMYVALALLGLTLGGLTGWALEHERTSDATVSPQTEIAVGMLGQLGLNPEV